MAYVRWQQKVISSEKGRRRVHYYLRDGYGKKVLAVVGREQSLRHMTYTVTSEFLLASPSLSPSSALDFGHGRIKLKSKREVIDWLSSLVSDSDPHNSYPMTDRSSYDEGAEPTTIPTPKGLSSGNMGSFSKEFSWLGSCSWNSKKKRKHYRSFCKNGVIISVHHFVFVMSDEFKRLVAYVEDFYEDAKTNNKMVVVRWFHKVDEVGIVLPPDVNDREIFFSLCLQDFSVECIDGLAAVLSAQDFDKFQNEARHKFSSWNPYLCKRQIDADEIKPFDITQVQGYWSQELLRSMYETPGTSIKLRLKITHGGSKSIHNDESGGPKEQNQFTSGNVDSQGVARDVDKLRSAVPIVCGRERPARAPSAPILLRKELLKSKLTQQQKHLAPGCRIEVLSQDSGIRGCWFRGVVLKRRHDRVKVRYEDLRDADDTGTLEEWVLASRVATPDHLGIRLCGRPVVRPDPYNNSELSCNLSIGSIVDARWHDGWWEGIVTRKDSDGKVSVYFPGERRVSTFGLGDLRSSQEWVGNKWNCIDDRPGIARSLDSENRALVEPPLLLNKFEAELPKESSHTCKPPLPTSEQSVERQKGAGVPNLVQFCNLDSLNWSSSKKRRRTRELGKRLWRSKRQCFSSGSSSHDDPEEESSACGSFSLTVVDHEKCKIGSGDPMFAVPTMALCPSLVMSQ